MRTTRLAPPIAFALIACLCPAISLYAQTSSGSIRGVVLDSTKARIAGATIEVTRPSSSQTRSLTADAQGEFRIENLAPGEWQVRVDAHGFARAAADVS